MKFLRKKYLLGGLASLLSTPAYAAPSFEDVAASKDATVIMVQEGTPLYQVASTVIRGDGSQVADGRLDRNELVLTNLCDSYEIRHTVSLANNSIARLTADIAGQAGMSELRDAMLLDKYTVRIIDGGSCAEPETVELKDGLIGDGVPRLHSQGGYVPVALPSALYAGPVRVRVEELPQEPTVVVEPVDAVVPETSPPVEAVAPVEQPVVSTPVTSAPVCPECPETPALYEARTRGFVGVGAHYIIEGGKAPLAGYGAWLEGRFEVPVSEQNALAFDARHAWISRLAYSENAKNTVLVGDVDFSAGFILPVSRFARLQFGANADVQEAGLEYAGLSAKTGRWAIGPELSLRLKAEKAYAVLHGSFGFGANATSADVEGFVPTNDPLNKAKAGAELAYRPVRAFGVRALAEVEYNSFDATTQDAGLLPQNDTISTVGVRFDLLNWLSVGADFVPYNSQLGNDTESVRIQGGLYHKF